MGQSTDAMLAYGYNLGSEDDWKLQGLGEYGELELDWYNLEGEGDFQEAAERRLLAQVAGFTERWAADVDGYWDREREAKARVGVEFDTHCSGGYPMFLLATKVITVYRGSVKEIDPATDLAVESDWDAKLRAALDALGINPTQEQAHWILCSYWG